MALRFYGHGTGGIDRVHIPLDAPARPIDVGATDFTIEFWLKASLAENSGSAGCGEIDGWITGNTVVDRDVFFAGDYGDWGISLHGGRVAFGVSVGNSGTTLCGSRSVADGAWHHIAVTRDVESGQLRIFVDGVPDGSAAGPAGDASYRDGRTSTYANDPYLVLGAEKHDAGASYPSFAGIIDEFRLSNALRYTDPFTPVASPFVPDGATVGLYHFDEGPAGACTGVIVDSASAAGGPSNGACSYGGSIPAGPVYTTDTPFPAPATSTPTHTPTNTPRNTPTNTPVNTSTNTPTNTPVHSPTDTASNTPTNTPAETVAPTSTSTPLSTPSSTNTWTPTAVSPTSPTPTASATALSAPTPTSPLTKTPAMTATVPVSATVSETPAASGSSTPAATLSATPSETQSAPPATLPTTPVGGTIPSPGALPHRHFLPIVVGSMLVMAPLLGLLGRPRR